MTNQFGTVGQENINYRYYKKLISDTIHECQNTGLPVAIFGASKCGWFIAKVLEENGINVDCYIDVKASKTLTNFHGKPVNHPNLIKEWPEQKPVVVGIFREKTWLTVNEQLRNSNVNVVKHDPFSFLFFFFTEIAKRKCNKDEFAKSIFNLKRYYSIGKYDYGQIFPDLFVSPFVTGNVTQKCNLKCIDCGQNIPYYKDAQTFDIKGLIGELKTYCESVELVPEISLHGGEPFLHPKIGNICQELAKIPNLIFINLVTNGTLYPASGTWEKFKLAGVDIHQSDYKIISKKRASIFDLCEENMIYCDTNYVLENEKWMRLSVKDYQRTEVQNHEIYRKCVETKICAQVMEGRLYRCPIVAHWGPQGNFPIYENKDFINLREGCDADALKKKLRKYLTKEDCLTACGHCNYHEAKLVSPALQLTSRNKKLIEAGKEIQ